MLILLSPAKTLDFDSPVPTKKYTTPDFLDDSKELVSILKKSSVADLQSLMGVSEKIASLNVQRFKEFKVPLDSEKARQAIYTFKGDVYGGLDVEQFKSDDIDFMQKHLRILSGLYGLLRPLDLMMAYRLEMGTKLKNKRGKHLYEFWGTQLTEAVDKAAQGQPIINLASQEYAKAVKPKQLSVPWIEIVFKDKVKGAYKVVGIHAKRARGLMAAYIIKNKIEGPKKLKAFAVEDYTFSADLSDEAQLVFCRG